MLIYDKIRVTGFFPPCNTLPSLLFQSDAIASSESMRITPSLRSQKGQAWSKLTTTFEWWEVEIVFRINGRGRVGADGLVSTDNLRFYVTTCLVASHSLQYHNWDDDAGCKW